MSDPPNHVATTTPNTLGPLARRLPLGIPQDDPGGVTYWRIWIPTTSVGTLRIVHDHPRARLILSRSNLLPRRLTTGDGEITYRKPSEEHGEFILVVTGLASGKITCTFTQKRWSRASPSPGAEPIVPWNFYYWPAEGNLAPSDGHAVLRRYATAVGKSGDDAARWELDNHVSASGDQWAGHCHNAAPASAIFEQPRPTVIGGVSFSEEEMEFLATEYVGNFGSVVSVDSKPAWELTGSSKPQGLRFYLPAYLKPGDVKLDEARVRDALATALSEELGPRGAARATTIVAENGGDRCLCPRDEGGDGQGRRELLRSARVSARRRRPSAPRQREELSGHRPVRHPRPLRAGLESYILLLRGRVRRDGHHGR